MTMVKDQKLERQDVLLDDNEFINCDFENCKMIYKGGQLPKLQQCRFALCSWQLDEAAQRTVLFLRAIYHSGPGGRELVEETLRHIRTR
jgi:hypothetical protein